MKKNKWLKIAKELQAISQIGIEYSKDNYDIERFQRIREISVEIVKEQTNLESNEIKNIFANEKGYCTPKVDIRAAIFKDGKILLVHEKIDNKWSLPGGWADIELSVFENIKKESFEEAGAIVEPLKVVGILDRNKHLSDNFPYSVYKIFVECKYISGKYVKNIETYNAKFFDLENLPELSLGRNTYKQVEMCFKSYFDKEITTYCD